MLKVAIPTANGILCTHFGHCEEFFFAELDEAQKRIIRHETKTPPPHEPGIIPRWIAEQKTNLILAGGMGAMAQQILTGHGIQVRTGIQPDTPEHLIRDFLNGTLTEGENVCEHGHGDSPQHDSK